VGDRRAVTAGVTAVLALGLAPAAAASVDRSGRLCAVHQRRASAFSSSCRTERALRRPLRTGSVAGRAPSAHVAIVGGRQISIEEAPWQVAVVALAPVQTSGMEVTVPILCGGAILSEREVLTSAECVFNPFSEAVERLAPEKLRVVAGSSEFKAAEAEAKGLHVSGVRTHPYYEPEASLPRPDDVAVLTLEKPLSLGPTENAVGLLRAGSVLSEAAGVTLTGYGEQSFPAEPTGQLDSLGMTLVFPRSCGGEADALFLCASAPGGAPCFGDYGGGLTLPTSPATLAGVMEVTAVLEKTLCRPGALAALANLAAPEIQDFIEGSETPPHAPRGGGAEISGVTTVGHTLSCEPGTWSYSPTFTFLFVDGESGQVLQQGPSPSYALTATDVGRTIRCEVWATNAGGTGIGRVELPAPIKAAPGPGAPSPTPASGPPPSAAPLVSEEGVLAVAAPGEPGGIRLSATRIAVAGGTAQVRLHCHGRTTCAGKLTITVAEEVRGERLKHSRPITIGNAVFSLKGEATRSVKVPLSSDGRHLLEVARGRLSANLTLAQREPRPASTHRNAVELVVKQSRSKKASGKRQCERPATGASSNGGSHESRETERAGFEPAMESYPHTRLGPSPIGHRSTSRRELSLTQSPRRRASATRGGSPPSWTSGSAARGCG
jgi:Trypsin